MAWAVPEHTRSQVNAAGAALISPSSSPDAVRRALGVVNNWRASHSVPLSSIDALRRAYPNYFADTSVFVAALRQAIG